MRTVWPLATYTLPISDMASIVGQHSTDMPVLSNQDHRSCPPVAAQAMPRRPPVRRRVRATRAGAGNALVTLRWRSGDGSGGARGTVAKLTDNGALAEKEVSPVVSPALPSGWLTRRAPGPRRGCYPPRGCGGIEHTMIAGDRRQIAGG
jgi:hypothetical protein